MFDIMFLLWVSPKSRTILKLHELVGVWKLGGFYKCTSLLTGLPRLVSRPGQSRRLLFQHCCHLFGKWVSNPLSSIALRRCKVQMVRSGASSYKIDYVTHAQGIISSKVTAILMNWWILPTGGVASRRVCAFSLRNRLLYNVSAIVIIPLSSAACLDVPPLCRKFM